VHNGVVAPGNLCSGRFAHQGRSPHRIHNVFSLDIAEGRVQTIQGILNPTNCGTSAPLRMSDEALLTRRASQLEVASDGERCM
jgi:hypothetical protein